MPVRSSGVAPIPSCWQLEPRPDPLFGRACAVPTAWLTFGSGPARLTRISAEALQRHRRVRSTQSTHIWRRLWLRGGGAIGQAHSAAYQLTPAHPPESVRGAPEALAAAGSGARVVEAGPPPPAQRETRLPTAVSQDTTRWHTTRRPRTTRLARDAARATCTTRPDGSALQCVLRRL
jgi:hypothetical protein